MAAWVSPGGKLAPIASHVKVLQVNELHFYRVGDKASEEQALQGLLVARESGKVTSTLQNGG